jgi:hypothetical protein
MNDAILKIRLLYRLRRTAEKALLRLNNQQLAMLRGALGWRPDLPEAERSRIVKQAVAVRKALVSGQFSGDPIPAEWSATQVSAMAGFVATSRLAAEPFQAQVSAYERELGALAEQMPAADFIADVRGLGLCFIWTMVGEAGDLSDYPDKSKLWKRLGLAVIDGKAQGKRTGDEALIQGYSPARRSAVYRIGDSLIKGNANGPYRTCYLDRKAFEAAKGTMSKMHCHRRAQRYMEKRLVRDYLAAWKAAVAVRAQQEITAAQ